MQELAYTFTIKHIGEHFKGSNLHLFDHRAGQTFEIQIQVDDKQLSLLNYQALSPLLSDLIDIAVAVHLVDRLARSHKRLPHDLVDMPRSILLRLPLRAGEKLNTMFMQQKLQDVLYWFTGDSWSFEFLSYKQHGRPAENAPPLPFEQQRMHETRVALWSGGLDAFAGAYQQLYQNDTRHYLFFGTGSNDYMRGVQKKTAQEIDRLFPKRTKLVQLPFRLRGVSDNIQTSSSMRSRGFVFLLLGAVCAYQGGKDTLYIHENGIGAINLPFRKSEVGLDHSRSVHPLSLVCMGDLLSTILEQPFFFKNPFLSWTKAQMCKEPLESGVETQVFATVSCDSRHRAYPMQCGYCSSCLLRRQAIAVSGVIDRTHYQITDNPSRGRKSEDATHYRAMLAQVDTMKTLLAAPDSWQKMSQRYHTLLDIADDAGEQEGMQETAQAQLLQLYRNYVTEWETVRELIGREFLE